MEIREFAERVLFGGTLDDKVFRPDNLIDAHRGSALGEVRLPGRPAGLSLADWHTRQRVPFPGPRELATSQGRGHALHFFANHELLALELMALALLRFPEAPAAFRRGLVATMREEQEHLLLYVDRMRDAGVDLGDIPVNDFFWRVISDMATPLDFVVRMSLTFEQANLDFALAYEEMFARAGDPTTAALLRRVYEDEIGHVRHGLAWLRAWKSTGVADWDAYADALPEDLTPARAKGGRYFAEARREVGFDEDYVLRLGTCSRSKGRPPHVWIFNPMVEADWAAAEAGHACGGIASSAVRALTSDFAGVPAFLAAHDDVVVVDTPPSTAWLTSLREAGFATPEFLTPDVAHSPAFLRRKLGELRPWGWSSALRARESSLLAHCQPGPGGGDDAAARGLSAKDSCLRWERALLEAARSGELEDPLLSLCSLVRPELHAPEVVSSLEELSRARAHRPSVERWVLKAPFSTSGRERVFLCGGGLDVLEARDEAWIRGRLARSGRLALEPWMDRVADLSLQLHCDAPTGGGRVVGVTRFACDARGRYVGTALGRRAAGLSREVRDLLYGGAAGGRVLEALEALGLWLARAFARLGHSGPAGVDLFLYRDPRDGSLAMRPVVEINPRWTMGRVALALEKRVAPHAVGAWVHLGGDELGGSPGAAWKLLRAGFEDDFARSPHPVVRRGIVATNDPYTARERLGVLVVEADVRSLLARAQAACPALGVRLAQLFAEG